MAVTQYNLIYTEARTPNLIREKTFNYEAGKINNPSVITELMNHCYWLNQKVEEYCYLLAVNTAGKLLGIFEISHGAMDYTVMNVREIMMRALLIGATSIAVVHNHPCGTLEPSEDDIKTTKKIDEAAKLLGIRLLDHVIVAEDTYLSLYEYGVI